MHHPQNPKLDGKGVGPFSILTSFAGFADADTMNNSINTLSKNKRKPFELTDYHMDFLKAVRDMKKDHCGPEDVRRTLCGLMYPEWELDALQANIAACSLLKHGYLNGGQTYFGISEKGLGAIS